MRLFGRRYRRFVPAAHRKLIRDQRLPKPNWFVGSAERPLRAYDPDLQAEIDAVKASIDKRREASDG